MIPTERLRLPDPGDLRCNRFAARMQAEARSVSVAVPPGRRHRLVHCGVAGAQRLESAMQPWQMHVDLVRVNNDQRRRDSRYAFHRVHLIRRPFVRIINSVADRWPRSWSLRPTDRPREEWPSAADLTVRVNPISTPTISD